MPSTSKAGHTQHENYAGQKLDEFKGEKKPFTRVTGEETREKVDN